MRGKEKAMKSKVVKSGAGEFAKGGSTSMHTNQKSGSLKPGSTSQEKSGGDGKFASGGKGKMFGPQKASTKTAGNTGKP